MLKKHNGTTYEELIRALLSLIPEGDEEGKFTEEFAEGRIVSMDELARKLVLD